MHEEAHLGCRQPHGVLPHCKGGLYNLVLKLSRLVQDRAQVSASSAQTVERGWKERRGQLGGRGWWKRHQNSSKVLKFYAQLNFIHRYIYQAPEASSLEDLTSQFKENTGLLLVRHPLVRLVSAYEDKMLNPHPFPYAFHHRQGENRLDRSFAHSSMQQQGSGGDQGSSMWKKSGDQLSPGSAP